jgi:hypothetical protein
MPLSLRDYVQETGRGGRDFKQTSCILFFSQFDKARAERVVGLTPNSNGECIQCEEYKRARKDLERVIAYALTGDTCRYSYLAKYVSLEDAHRETQSCANGERCDNCSARKGKQVPACANGPIDTYPDNSGSTLRLVPWKSCVTDIVEDCLLKLLELRESNRSDNESEVEKNMKETLSERFGSTTDTRQKLILMAFAFKSAKANKSLVVELLRYLRVSPMARLQDQADAKTDWKRVKSIVASIRSKRISFFVHNARLPESCGEVESNGLDVELSNEVAPFTILDRRADVLINVSGPTERVISKWKGIPMNWLVEGWIDTLPFLVQFEICRYDFIVNWDLCISIFSDAPVLLLSIGSLQTQKLGRLYRKKNIAYGS